MSKLRQLLSQSAAAVLTKAQQLADRRHEPVQSAHVAVALFRVDRTVAYDLLQQYSAAPPSLRKTTFPPNTKEVPFVLEEAARLARSYGFTHIEPEHLLYVIVNHRSLLGHGILRSSGVRETPLNEKLTEWLYGVSILASVAGQQAPTPAARTKQGEHPQTSVIESTTTNLTNKARQKLLDPVVGRDAETDSIIRTLLRRKKNNPLLIGDPGVGKTAIVHGLATRIATFDVPAPLLNTSVLELSVPALIAGTMYRGQFEERFRALLSELATNGPTIVFIDEIHTITGTGSTEGSLDLANLLKPLLASGDITVIGATTHEEYVRYFASDRALERRFQPVTISEPDAETALPMIKVAAKQIATHHHVTIPIATQKEAIALSQRYLPDRSLPDKALDILDETAAAHKQADGSSTKLSTITKQLAAVIDRKHSLVESGKLEQAVALRRKEQTLRAALARAQKQSTKDATALSAADCAATVARLTGIPLDYISAKTTVDPHAIRTQLQKKLVGQRHAITAVTEALTRAQLGLHAPQQPLASFVFVGPTGVGKTETARLIASEVFGTDKALIKVDMSEFGERHSVSQLIGSPKGYVGYDDGGTLVDRVRRQPFSVILFDEVEKAHPDVFNILLQILEDGTLTDTHQRTARFGHSIIILTSNLGTELLDTEGIGFTDTTPSAESTITREIADFFRPELLGRLTDVVTFQSFTNAEIISLIKRRLKVTVRRLRTRGIYLTIDPQTYPLLATHYDPHKGARSVNDTIARIVENTVVAHVATSTEKHARLTIDSKNHIVVTPLTR